VAHHFRITQIYTIVHLPHHIKHHIRKSLQKEEQIQDFLTTKQRARLVCEQWAESGERRAESGKLESGEQKMENINQIYNISAKFRFQSLTVWNIM
jgi:hypothetical protein